jgi:hypothetical protein
MLIGFIFSNAIVIGLGTLQAQMLLPTMANLQGNSMPDLCSIVMFLLIFWVRTNLTASRLVRDYN